MFLWRTLKQRPLFLPDFRRTATWHTLKYFVLLFAVAIVVVLGAAWMLYRAELAELEEGHVLHQQHAVDSARAAVGARLDSIFRDVIFLAANEAMRNVLRESGDASLDRLAGAWLAFARAKGYYRMISWLGENGAEQLRVALRDPGHVASVKPKTGGEHFYFARLNELAPGEIFMSPFEVTDEHGSAPEIVIRIATPVFDDSGLRRGVVLVEYRARDLLGLFVASSARFHGDIILVDHTGRLVRNVQVGGQPDPGFKPGDSLATSDPVAWQRIAHAESGDFETESGKGSFVSILPSELAGEASIPAPYKIAPAKPRGSAQPESWKVVTYHPNYDSAVASLRNQWAMYALLLVLLVGIAASRLAGAQAQRQAAVDELSSQEQDYMRQLGVLTRHLITLQDQSRRRLALELHDRTSPNLMAIAVNLETIAKAMLKGRISAKLQNRLADTRALLEDTTVAVREITAELRPSLLDYAGLPAALDQLAQQFARRTGISVDVVTGEFDARCGHSTQTSMYYIAQEALTNCAKHAHANALQIDARYVGAHVTMTITDDGAGFDSTALNQASSKPGLGLLTMTERAKAAGGNIEIRSHPGRGTTIRVKIPLNAPEHGDGIVSTGTTDSGVA